MESKEEIAEAIRKAHAENIFIGSHETKINMPIQNKQAELQDEAIPYPQDFSQEAYIGLVGEFVEAIKDYTEADPAAILMSFLTAFSCYVGKKAYLRSGTEKFTSNIFTLIIGDTAKARKGTSWTPIREIFLRLDPMFEKEHIKGGFGSGEGIIARVSDKKYDNETKEYIDRTDQRLLIYEPEFSAVLKVASREGNLLSDIIRKAWDNYPLENNTKLEGTSIRSSNPHISILAHITMMELDKLMKDVDTGNGFYNRFLFTCVRRNKLLPIADPVPDSIYNNTVQSLKGVIDWLDHLDNRVLQFNESALILWKEIYQMLANADYGEKINNLTARAEAYILRLSLLFAILDKSKYVTSRHILAAQAIWDRNVQSIRFLFGEDKESNKLMNEILEGLRKYGNMSQSDIYKKIFNCNVDIKRIKRALQGLSAKGKICVIDNKDYIGKGRPPIIWGLK